jgi:high-affinity iron transporter
MFAPLVILFREGFESFLTVAIILTYLRKTGRDSLRPAVYWGVVTSIVASFALGWLLSSINKPLWEGVLGIVAALLVATFVIQMWRTAPTLKRDMEARLSGYSSNASRVAAVIGVFLFTVFMVTREGMESALMLIQVRHQTRFLLGCIAGLTLAALMSWAWAHFGHRINVRRFFQVTGFFLLLFTLQIAFYSLHELSEAGALGSVSEAIHTATEPYGPEGRYGKWFSLAMFATCGAWLLTASMRDRSMRARLQPVNAP